MRVGRGLRAPPLRPTARESPDLPSEAGGGRALSARLYGTHPGSSGSSCSSCPCSVGSCPSDEIASATS